MEDRAAKPNRALLVIDVQNEYVTGKLPIAYPPVEDSLANIGQAIDVAREHGIPIVAIQQSAPAGSQIFARGSHGWDFHPVVGRRPRDHHLEKTLPGSFTGTDLGAWLAASAIDTVTIVGYMTHNCDDATARQALHLGFAVEVLSDATGTIPMANRTGRATAEEIHRVEMVVMQSRFAAVLTTDEWIDALQNGKAAERDSILQSYRTAVAAYVPGP